MASRDTGKRAGTSVKELLDRLSRRRHSSEHFPLWRSAGPPALEDIVQEAYVGSYAATRRPGLRSPRRSLLRCIRSIAPCPTAQLNLYFQAALADPDLAAVLREGDYARALHEARAGFLDCCRAVASLPSDCRRAFILRKVYGLSLDEIGEQLDLRPEDVQALLASGLAALLEYREHRSQTQRVPLRHPRGRAGELHGRD